VVDERYAGTARIMASSWLQTFPAASAAAALQEWATAHGISLPNHYDTTNQPTFKLDDHHPKNILQVCV
jgi:hypothetical protein